jgi:6-phosphogluconolactonase
LIHVLFAPAASTTCNLLEAGGVFTLPEKLRIVYSVEPDAAALARRAAQYFAEKSAAASAANGRARIAISGGSTPKAAFALLADTSQPWRAEMPWNKLDLWWVDERCVPPDDPDSNYRMTREALLSKVPLKPEQIHRMEGELDPSEAAARYEMELRNGFGLRDAELPRFDLLGLGMGPDGHTASLFPHTEALHEADRLVTANHVGTVKDSWRVTLTQQVLNNAADVFFLIGGQDKAEILKEVLLGPHDPERLPSQLISPAGGILTLLLDRAAAALLPARGEGSMGTIERI